MENSKLEPQKKVSASERVGMEHSRVSIQAESIASERHPDRNEDTVFGDQETGIFGVFDGVGGYDGGDKASSIAKDAVKKTLQRFSREMTLQQTQEIMSLALIEANEAVIKEGRKTQGSKMATTASIGIVWNGAKGEKKAIIGNVGDSRVYLFRNEKLEQVTLDDNRVSSSFPSKQARQLQAKLNNVVDPERELTRNERDFFNSRNQIAQALGSGHIVPRITTIDLLPLDKLLVCSDGISDNLTDKEMEGLLNSNPDTSIAIRNLIEASKTRSRTGQPRSKPDDMTALIVEAGIDTKDESGETIKLKEGASVRVQRSNGVIEPGWQITRLSPQTGDAVIVKEMGNRSLVKHVPISMLERLNRPAVIADIETAENVPQLIDTVSQLDGLQGSEIFFRPKELIEIMNHVLAGETPLESLTRSGGLREKVADLLKHRRVK